MDSGAGELVRATVSSSVLDWGKHGIAFQSCEGAVITVVTAVGRGPTPFSAPLCPELTVVPTSPCAVTNTDTMTVASLQRHLVGVTDTDQLPFPE